MSTINNSLTKISRRRLRRDLLELEGANLSSIAARPMDSHVNSDIFEWHANIKPNEGVYAGVYFHLILTFPHSYPSKPPKVRIMTPISHPNVFDQWICLSMLREHTGTDPYEGWSGAYSITSILMQLQSFLFADKIDQDEGYQANARLSTDDVKQSIRICKSFRCKCSHSHTTPYPAVKPPPVTLVSIHPTDPHYTKYMDIEGSNCQSISSEVGVYAQYGCSYGKIMYEGRVEWKAALKDHKAYIGFGFGTKDAYICGQDTESFGYYDNGSFYNGESTDHFSEFSVGDTITCALDFDSKQIHYAKNGKLMSPIQIEKYLYNKEQLLFPLISMKAARVALNFGAPQKPCEWLSQNGFKTLEQFAMEHGIIKSKQRTNRRKKGKDLKKKNVEWHSRYIIDYLWVEIFEYLRVQDVYRVQFVCRKWNKLTHTYNMMERGEIYCYYTKIRLGHKRVGRQPNILGIGLHIKETEVGFRVELNSQMDILSYRAWRSGCRIGVWGEALTHFLPLPMNKQHSDEAHESMIKAMKDISQVYTEIQKKSHHGRERMEHPNSLERMIHKSKCLQIVDTLITMMNQLVAQFVTKNEESDPKSVSMVLCEKVVLGYCALYHLLLYLRSKNKKEITRFANKTAEQFIHMDNGSHKSETRDLGKLLIYLMISNKYEWKDIAARYVEESFTRRIRWFVKNEAYTKYNTTEYVDGRIRDSFIASKTGRRLVRFQVWFMANNASETLKGYNDRLGRPKREIRDGIVAKTKQILSSTSYGEYFKELKVSLKDVAAMDRLLRYAVCNSYHAGYHWNNEVHQSKHHLLYKRIAPPSIKVYDEKKIRIKKNKKTNTNKSRANRSHVIEEKQAQDKPPSAINKCVDNEDEKKEISTKTRKRKRRGKKEGNSEDRSVKSSLNNMERKTKVPKKISINNMHQRKETNVDKENKENAEECVDNDDEKKEISTKTRKRKRRRKKEGNNEDRSVKSSVDNIERKTKVPKKISTNNMDQPKETNINKENKKKNKSQSSMKECVDSDDGKKEISSKTRKRKRRRKKEGNNVHQRKETNVDKENKEKNKSQSSMKECVDNDDEKKEILSKAHKRKLRKKKEQNQAERVESQNMTKGRKTFVAKRPTRAPVPCNRFKQNTQSQNKQNIKPKILKTQNKQEIEPKLSKTQKRKLRRKNKNSNGSK